MKKTELCFLLLFFILQAANAQEYFTVKRYQVDVSVNKDASLDIKEIIDVHFTSQRHGILRFVPYKYPLQKISSQEERAELQQESGGYRYTIVDNIKVENRAFTTYKEGDYKTIRIGSEDEYVDGDQQYILHYRILNAINFFNDHSELYLNIIGNQWNTTIDTVLFSVTLYQALPAKPFSFVATGLYGSKENNTTSYWQNNQAFSGQTTSTLYPQQGLTIGIKMPLNFLDQNAYLHRQFAWLLLPLFVFFAMYYTWKRRGKDEPITIQTEYYPPENISPAIAGYIVDTRLNPKDLTALVPYWGAAGYLQILETEESKLFGAIKTKEYTFVKLRDLPAGCMAFEQTLFNGIFEKGDRVPLKDLKHELYKTMAKASKELEREVDRSAYYEKSSRGLVIVFIILGIIISALAFFTFVAIGWPFIGLPIALLASGIIIIIFGSLMAKKTPTGTALYQKLAGFKEFIQTVEKDRLATFLKQDEHYFDKVLPFAIVFNVADKWKDKLQGLEIPPPHWYSGSYGVFNTNTFMTHFDNSMNSMSSTFYSSPGSSGSSFGGAGSSGGGSGGGGGSSW